MRKNKSILPWLIGLAGLVLILNRQTAQAKPKTKRELDTQVRNAIRKYSRLYGVPAQYLYGIALTESYISPRWAFSYHRDGKSFGIYGLTKMALRDIGMTMDQIKNSVDAQTQATARLLRKLYKTLGSWGKAIQAYHIGIGNLRKGRLITRARRYLNRVITYSRRW